MSLQLAATPVLRPVKRKRGPNTKPRKDKGIKRGPREGTKSMAKNMRSAQREMEDVIFTGNYGKEIANQVRASQVTKKDIADQHGITVYKVNQIAKVHGVPTQRRRTSATHKVKRSYGG